MLLSVIPSLILNNNYVAVSNKIETYIWSCREAPFRRKIECLKINSFRNYLKLTGLIRTLPSQSKKTTENHSDKASCTDRWSCLWVISAPVSNPSLIPLDVTPSKPIWTSVVVVGSLSGVSRCTCEMCVCCSSAGKSVV